MLRKILAGSIASMLFLIMAFPPLAAANSKADKQARFAEKVRAGVMKLDVGPDAQVEVKLRNKTKLSGYIKESNDESFVVTDNMSGTDTVVAYPDVTQVKGNNLSKGAKIAIGLAIGAGVLAIIYFAAFAGKH